MAYLYELLCHILLEEGWVPDQLQDVIDHQIGIRMMALSG